LFRSQLRAPQRGSLQVERPSRAAKPPPSRANEEQELDFHAFAIDGPFEIRPRKIADERGYFSEIFRHKPFSERAGDVEFVQDNQSLSIRTGTIRGLHFQTRPAAQGKLVRCLAGRLFDVVVDLRRNSSTYGKWISVELSPEENNQLWVPVGFAHGFCTLEPNSVISYRVTDYYSPDNDEGVAWDDPDIAVEWAAVADPDTLSVKDRQQPKLADLPAYFSMKDR
jgi:dTDP-4-dehydrorhamnose 3,5-epimerase